MGMVVGMSADVIVIDMHHKSSLSVFSYYTRAGMGCKAGNNPPMGLRGHRKCAIIW